MKSKGEGNFLTPEQLTYFQNILQLDVRKSQILASALTHRSIGEKDNERLEFLGDRVLGLVIAEHLYHKKPLEHEGAMAKRLAYLVSKETLADIALKIGLDQIILVSKSEENSGGRTNASILADCCEAVIAALYLEYGWNVVQQFILHNWQHYLVVHNPPPLDPKTILQEWGQASGLPLPEYQILSQLGPAHQPLFEIAVHVPGYPTARGQGSSKKIAERQAAYNFLVQAGLLQNR